MENPTIDVDNLQFKFILDVLENTDKSFSISAKAGCGKTTLINYWTSITKKSYIKIAPTGLAALLIGGVTLNSLCHIPWDIITPNDERLKRPEIYKFFRLPAWKRDTLRNVDVIVLDECSMIQTWHLSILLKLLKAYRGSKPLPQFVFSFDAYQLGAVVKDEDWEILKNFYETPYFFSSDLYEEVSPILIELDKVYRQTDKKFVDTLSRVRLAEHTKKDIKYLNKRYDPLFNSDEFVRGFTHRWQVNKYNAKKYQALPGEEVIFPCREEGKIPKDKPAPKNLKLKVGAKVKICINDPEKQFVNGTQGVIHSFGNDTVVVDTGEKKIRISRHTWQNNNYVINEDKSVDTIPVGSYTQIPIKLFYACTVHSLQGSTVDNLALDLKSVFANAQGYVGVSRVTSYEGLHLLSPLNMDTFTVDDRIKKFKQKVLKKKHVKKYFKDKYGENWKELFQLEKLLLIIVKLITKTDVQTKLIEL